VAEQAARTRPWSPPPENKGPAQQVAELKDLVVGYAKQETVDPLKTLGRYLLLGMIGSVLMSIGIIFLLLAVLRGFQDIEIFNDSLEPEGGTWSWVPYFITTLVGAAIAVFFALRMRNAINSGKARHADTHRAVDRETR